MFGKFSIGKNDDIVKPEASMIAYEALKKDCVNIDLYMYNGRHKIGIQYLKRVKSFIQETYN